MIRICHVGPMIGKNQGYITTQGEKLSELFKIKGHQVIVTSSKISRIGRFLDIIYTMY